MMGLKQLLAHALGVALAERLCSYFLKRTESIAANSTRELIVWGFQRLFKKKEVTPMSFSKSFAGPAGSSLTIAEENGSVKLIASEQANVGGGAIQGALSIKGSAEIDLEAKMLIDAGFDLAAAKFPSAAGLIEAAKAGVDAELAKL